MDTEIQDEMLANQVGFKELYEEVKPIIWILKTTREFKGEEQTQILTAFAISTNGCLITSARGGWTSWKEPIFARRLTDVGFDIPATLVDVKRSCGLVLLKVSVGSDIACGKFGTGALFMGDLVMAVGNPSGFVGSGLVGRVVYPCISDNKDYNFDDMRKCGRYKSDALSNTPPYRIMGHVLNSYFFSKEKVLKGNQVNRQFEENLQAKLPIIQCSGLVGDERTSGAPIFNLHGEIIGMYLFEKFGYNIGIHVTALNRFWSVGPGPGLITKASTQSESSSSVSKKMKYDA